MEILDKLDQLQSIPRGVAGERMQQNDSHKKLRDDVGVCLLKLGRLVNFATADVCCA